MGIDKAPERFLLRPKKSEISQKDSHRFPKGSKGQKKIPPRERNIWIKSDKVGLNWYKLYQVGSKWFKSDQRLDKINFD